MSMTLKQKEMARNKDIPMAIKMMKEHNSDLFIKKDVEVEEVRNGRFGTYKEKVIIQYSDADDLIAEFMCIHIKYGRKDAIKHLKNLLSYIPKK